MVIGLCGYKRAGKTTVANHLIKEHGFKPINFKDSLVESMKEKFPELLRELTLIHDGDVDDVDWLFENKPPIMRALMQNYGTNVMRAIDTNVWVDKWKVKIGEGKELIVTDDVRFYNELNALGDVNGVLIRVVRPDITTGGTHQSETEQESFIEDFTVFAEPGSHESIYRQIDSIIQTLKDNVD